MEATPLIEFRAGPALSRPTIFSRNKFVNVIGDAMKFLRADHKIDMWQIFYQRFAARLRHAAKETENNVRPLFRHPTQHSHFAERLLVGHVSYAARIQEDVVLGLFDDPLVTARHQRMRDLF